MGSTQRLQFIYVLPNYLVYSKNIKIFIAVHLYTGPGLWVQCKTLQELVLLTIFLTLFQSVTAKYNCSSGTFIFVSALCKCSTVGVVAFSATITNDITSFGTKQPVVFDKVITNVGGAYDSRHGSFRAPVDGIYKLSFSALQGKSTMWIGLELVRDGTVIARVKTGDNGYWNLGTNVITIRLNAGDDVWVRHMTDTDSKHVVADKGFFTSFSGHLIKAD